ncbi:DUF2911 domain-containing protein [Neolewinella antarctica]|uniref:DUF2911 domain-containing protein n=1 Tax=Neolewinella antarctica TaxID=442734 RepID=A0ABX0XI86_9BACT|nr:DUF2911 domain-containing protein [Neolewinella antarctica]NJC28442.1 hypothetical protein [Neolewinella antarctica]
MRKQFFTLLLAFTAFGLTAQINTPSPSPMVKMETVVGLTDVHVEYSRPGMKGRTIFAADGLVPYGEIWRTGANQATKITFAEDVMVGGQEVKAGSYAVLTKPAADQWEVMLFPYESGSWNSYVEQTPAATVMAKTMSTGSEVETFTIDVRNYTTDAADLVMMWGNTAAMLPIQTNAKEAVQASIERVMAGPSMNDYFNAATFTAENGDANEALKMIMAANAMAGDNPRYWMLRRQGLIQEQLGMKDEAKKSFEMSLEKAKENDNMDYVRMNEQSLKMM